MNQFVKDRNEALLSLDKDKILGFATKYDINWNPSNELVFWAAIHKARIEVVAISEEEKEISRKWLIDNGFYPGIN